ncbi:MAG: hypothetical protein DRJ69_03090 [Thermoprotei archaeon]|nr:MAG: hypothetical protein DRJ69_03090 [Thermoprotei archaeon]
MSSSALRSRETSRVFWALLRSNEKTPLDISLMLRISQSAVVKHLDKLRAVGLVKRGKKVGRYQPYEVDWDRACELLLREAPIFGPMLESGTLKELADRLLSNEHFKKLVREYFTALARIVNEHGRLRALPPSLTIQGAIESFEGWLNVYASELKEDVEEPTLKDLIVALKEWRSRLPGFVSAEELAVKEALQKTGIANL